jgi:hypothetical protein
MQRFKNSVGVVVAFAVRLWAWLGNATRATTPRLSEAARKVRLARQVQLYGMELAGVVLVTYGVAQWCVPAAVILGGLVLVAAVEVRPHVTHPMPDLPVPEVLLRGQAEQAARLLNSARYGVAEVDAAAFERLTRADCERLITVARSLGEKT